MARFSLKFASLFVSASLCAFGFSSTAAAQKGGVRKPKKTSPKSEQNGKVVPVYTPAPLQPLPLEQVPAVAPRVHFAAGELTIVAHNSTLSDVLKEVHEQTGAELDIPPNANERVVADLGPGPAREVLAELLNGTHFNYVMVGSSSDPAAIKSLVLTARQGGPDTTTTASNLGGVPQRGLAPPNVANIPVADVGDSDGAEDNGAEVPEDQPAEQADQNAQNPGQTPKTPEQLLQELQRQQQQLQQQQPGQTGQSAQPAQPGQTNPPQGLLPNQPPTAAPANPNKPE